MCATGVLLAIRQPRDLGHVAPVEPLVSRITYGPIALPLLKLSDPTPQMHGHFNIHFRVIRFGRKLRQRADHGSDFRLGGWRLFLLRHHPRLWLPWLTSSNAFRQP